MSYGPPQIFPPLPINEPGALGSIAQPTLVPDTGLSQFESPQPIAGVAPTPDPVPPDAYVVPGGDATMVNPALALSFPGPSGGSTPVIEPYPQPPPSPPQPSPPPIPFTPAMLPGLEWWLRADLGVTLALGTNVSAWNDQSGAGDPNRNLSQATANKQPTLVANDPLYNNQATINFITTLAVELLAMNGLWSNAPIMQPYSIVVVGNDGDAGTMIFIGELLANNWYLTATSGHYGASVGATLLGTTADSVTPKVLMIEYNDPNSTIRVSEETVEATGNIGAGVLPQLEISGANGGTNALNPGKIAEIVAVRGILSNANRIKLMTYFNTRYAIVIGP